MKKPFIILILLALVAGAALLHTAGFLDIAGAQTRTVSMSGHDVQYSANWMNWTKITTDCSTETADLSGNGTLHVLSHTWWDCQLPNSRVTIQPQLDLHDYQNVIIHRQATLYSACEGSYLHLQSSINGNVKEFNTATGINVITQSVNLGDLYINNDGNRIRIEGAEGAFYLPNEQHTFLTLDAFANCQRYDNAATKVEYTITGIETPGATNNDSTFPVLGILVIIAGIGVAAWYCLRRHK